MNSLSKITHEKHFICFKFFFRDVKEQPNSMFNSNIKINFQENDYHDSKKRKTFIIRKIKKIKLYLLPVAAFDEHNLNYYQEYCKLFISNIVLTTQV